MPRNDDKIRMGQRIRELREALDLGQHDLGQLLDEKTGQTQISRWENGSRVPSTRKLTKLASVLQTTTDYLLFGEGTPTEGEGQLKEYELWVRALAPNDITDVEKQALRGWRWPPSLGTPEPEWYDDVLTMLRGVERKAKRRGGTRH